MLLDVMFNFKAFKFSTQAFILQTAQKVALRFTRE